MEDTVMKRGVIPKILEYAWEYALYRLNYPKETTTVDILQSEVVVHTITNSDEITEEKIQALTTKQHHPDKW